MAHFTSYRLPDWLVVEFFKLAFTSWSRIPPLNSSLRGWPRLSGTPSTAALQDLPATCCYISALLRFNPCRQVCTCWLHFLEGVGGAGSGLFAVPTLLISHTHHLNGTLAPCRLAARRRHIWAQGNSRGRKWRKEEAEKSATNGGVVRHCHTFFFIPDY